MRRNRGADDDSTGLLGILLAVLVILGLLWHVFGNEKGPFTTASTDSVEIEPAPTTPHAPR